MKWKTLASLSLLTIVLANFFAPAFGKVLGQHQITGIQGDVSIKRRLWIGYYRAEVGRSLSSDDWLRVGQNSSVQVLCNDWELWRPPVGEFSVSSGCPRSGGARARIGPTRASQLQGIPYLISPRNTAILPGQPVRLTWNSVAGATTYEVTIRYLSRPIWSVRVTEPVAVFEDIHQLRPGRSYNITISAVIGATNTGPTAPPINSTAPLPTITVLSDANVQALAASPAQLDALSLDTEANTLAMAHLYRSYGLYQQSLELLAAQISTGTAHGAIYQLQGELYQQVGLERRAQASYQTALALAQPRGDVSQQTELQERLGQIALGLEEYESAIHYLTRAEDSYRQFLDISEPAVQTQLEKLQRDIQRAQARLPKSQF
jgi:hypothetical protein